MNYDSDDNNCDDNNDYSDNDVNCNGIYNGVMVVVTTIIKMWGY